MTVKKLPRSMTGVNFFKFNTAPGTQPDQLGRLYWDANDRALSVVSDAGEPVILQIGQEMHVRVWNDTGVDIPNGALVYPTGSVAYRPTAALAKADDIATCKVRGITTMAIPKNTSGIVATFGLIRGIDTQTPGWNEGDFLYLSETTAGAAKNTPPTAGYTQQVGYVLRRHVTDGVIFFSPYPRPAFGTVAGGDYTTFDYRGRLGFVGEAKVTRQTPFTFNYSEVTGQGKPTLVNRGIFYGFSLPIYNSDDEELFACSCMPGDWDGVTDPHVILSGWLDTANTDKNFKLQVSAEVYDPVANDVVPITTNDYPVSTATGTAAQYASFKVDFTLDASAMDIVSGDPLGIRIRRIAADADEITGEFVVEGAVLSYTVDKLGV